MFAPQNPFSQDLAVLPVLPRDMPSQAHSSLFAFAERLEVGPSFAGDDSAPILPTRLDDDYAMVLGGTSDASSDQGDAMSSSDDGSVGPAMPSADEEFGHLLELLADEDFVRTPASRVTRAPAAKRTRPAAPAAPAVVRYAKRRRFADLALPVPLDAGFSLTVSSEESKADKYRLDRLAAAKKNGNYDSYIRTSAFDDMGVPLQASLVGTPLCPGFLVALQSTDGRGITDEFLRDTPGGVSKSILFFRTCFYRLLQQKQISKSDRFRSLFTSPGLFEQTLASLGTNLERAQFLASEMERLVAIVRPHEAFHLSRRFVAGIAPHATVQNCLKLTCDLCGQVQTWRKCRRCHNSKSRRRNAKGSGRKAGASRST